MNLYFRFQNKIDFFQSLIDLILIYLNKLDFFNYPARL